MKRTGLNKDFRAGSFFALRTPALPQDEFLSPSDSFEAAESSDLERALSRDRSKMRTRIRSLIARPEIKDSLFLASPSLDESCQHWLQDPDSERGRKIERSLVKYLTRMTRRSTPFGLFAGHSIGSIDRSTDVELKDAAAYGRHTRLDMDYLSSLADAVAADGQVRDRLRYLPNSSLYEAAGRLRFAESLQDSKTRSRSHRLVAVEMTDYLASTLQKAAGGATSRELATALVDDEITYEEAKEFIDEVVDSQILVPAVAPNVTGDEPTRRLIAELEEVSPDAAEALKAAQLELGKIDEAGLGASPELYRAIARGLEDLPAKVEISRLFQVDMVKPARAQLGPKPLDEISRAVSILARLARRPAKDPLAEFKRQFSERYLDKEVPLAEVLDEEIGIGFEASEAPSAEAAPLLEGLAIGGRAAESGLQWRPRDSFLLRKLGDSLEKKTPIELSEADIESLSERNPPPLPDSFSVMALIEADSPEAVDRGDFRVLVHGGAGPPSARLLGRFCHSDPQVLEAVTDCIQQEEKLNPDAIFAEVVHLPEGRVGNVLLRPVLRDYEITYLGASGIAAERQIPITDLTLSVAGDKVVVRSRRLGKEVIPRLSCAHNFTFRSLGVYRFLCTLQHQNTAHSISWDWGPLESAPFLPRVSVGKVVLSRARWLITREELKAFDVGSDSALFQSVQQWRVRRGLPRWIVLADMDNELVVDLDNVLSVESFVHSVRARNECRVVELFPLAEAAMVSGPEGKFSHEILVPFVRIRDPDKVDAPSSQTDAVAPLVRNFAPGSEWLYLKIYTGTSTADLILRDLVGSLIRESSSRGHIDRWFFLRYGDPSWHLRLRVHGDPAFLLSSVLPRIQQDVQPLIESGAVHRLQVDTYEREVERYGGNLAIAAAEEIFHADSVACLEIVNLTPGDEGAEARWRLAFRGADRLIGDFGLDEENARSLIRAVRDSYSKEFSVENLMVKQIGQRFSQLRAELEDLLDSSNDATSALLPGLQALDARSAAIRPVVERLRVLEADGSLVRPLAQIVPSLVHMHVNRMLRSAQRAQELVLYHFLDRIYLGRKSRSEK